MTSTQQQHQAIGDFENRYGYDGQFMHALVDHLPGGFARFEQFQPMAHQRDVLSKEVFWLARVTAMQTEDCGGCLQLSIRMAREDGVPGALLAAALHIGGGEDEHAEQLTPAQQQIVEYTRQVARNSAVSPTLLAAMQADYSTAELLELGICIASAKVFPTIKRAIGATQSCERLDIAV